MKAFEVYYETGDSSDSTVLLVNDESELEKALSDKDRHFRIGDKWSKITRKKEIPLSNVFVKELSITELKMVLKDN
jgi:hypothetical protein